MTHRSRVFPLFAAALAVALPTTAVEAQTVRVALIVPADRAPRADYLAGVDIASRDSQAWFQMQLGDTRTFVLDPAGVRVLHSTHTADWFSTNPRSAPPSVRFFRNVAVEDAESLLGHRIGAGHTPDVWALYVDADPACGQCGGCGGGGLLVIAKNDLRGLVGEPGLANLYNADVGNTTAITTAAPDGTYHVRVRAKNSAGVGGASTEVSFSIDSAQPSCSGPPGTPAGLTFAQAGNSIDLRWTAAPGSVSFVVEAGSATGLSNRFNGNVGAQPELAASAPAGTYFVRVRGVNACGMSQASNEVVVVVP